MAALILVMAAATVFEKFRGTEYALSHFYHSPLFIALWAVVAVCGLIYIFSVKMQRNPATLGIHFAFALILAGALLTFLTGKSGEVHLRLGEPATEVYILDNGDSAPLPFSISLERFEIEYYRGSRRPSDFISEVTIDGKNMVISMNNIAKYEGYRFYQADFDPDMHGSILAVSHDPWGVGVTYAGYLLLALSMLGFFFQRDSGFRRALRRLSGTAAAAVIMLFAGSVPAGARSIGDLPAIPRDVAEQFGDLYVYYNDRICPLQTLARDYTLKAYGKAHYGPYSAEQTVTAWLFYYDWWRTVPVKLKSKEKGTAKEQEKLSLLPAVASGEAFNIFPIADSTGKVEWYNPVGDLPAGLDYEHWVFVRKSLDLMGREVAAENWSEVSRILSRIRKYQEKTASEMLPPRGKVRAEKFWNRISRPMIPFMASISLGMVFFILFGIWLAREKKPSKALQNVLLVLAAVLLAYLVLTIGLRWYISGHGPFAGTWSVMMLMAFLATLAQILLARHFPLVQPLGFLVAGFTMLVAALAGASPKITHLMPVLQSPLLSIHVLSMMISYTLFGLVALNGFMGIFMKGKAAETLRDVSLVVLYPAVFLITFGTFIGAVWANISWGSYWAWDPKETWALITLLVYAGALHGSSLKFMKNPRVFHIYTLLAFLCVLITYFGVNLILGGMHSYA